MKKTKVSVIVPVHNAGLFFEKCLLSLINQSLKDIEIILILDCPTDGSDKVAEEYAKKDERIKIIRNDKNLHISLSRNKGMSVSNGEYIGFHDHDDYSDLNMYEQLYNKAKEKESEVVRCNFKCVYISQPEKKDLFCTYDKVSLDISKKHEVYRKISENTISGVIWNYIFKRDFIEKHSLNFVDSKTTTAEDRLFLIGVYKYLEKIDVVDEFLYYHIFHSINTGKSYNYRAIKNQISFYEKLNTFLEENKIEHSTRLLYFSENMAKSLYSASRQALLGHSIKKGVSEIMLIRENTLMMECVSFLHEKENKHLLSKMKPTIRIFLRIIKSNRKTEPCNLVN